MIFMNKIIPIIISIDFLVCVILLRIQIRNDAMRRAIDEGIVVMININN